MFTVFCFIVCALFCTCALFFLFLLILNSVLLGCTLCFLLFVFFYVFLVVFPPCFSKVLIFEKISLALCNSYVSVIGRHCADKNRFRYVFLLPPSLPPSPRCSCIALVRDSISSHCIIVIIVIIIVTSIIVFSKLKIHFHTFFFFCRTFTCQTIFFFFYVFRLQ